MEKYAEKRFGAIAVEKGFITKEQLLEALNTQVRENLEEGKHRLLGKILVEQELITESQVSEILEVLAQAMKYMIGTWR